MIDRLSAFTQTGLNRPGRPVKSTDSSLLWLAPVRTNNNALLACSAADVDRQHRELFGMRRLGEDRRGFFDHFKPPILFKGVSWYYFASHIVFGWMTRSFFSFALFF